MPPNLRAFTLWPEWCAAFKGVLLRDGSPSQLDKEWENRPIAPWSTIAPQRGEPGPWFCMHAGAHIGGKPRNEGALLDVLSTALYAGWRHSVILEGEQWSHRVKGNEVKLWKGDVSMKLHPDLIVRSAIVALIRVVDVQRPGEGEWTPWRFPDRYGWKLEVRPLPVPIPCRGAQGLWFLDDATDAAVRVQVGTV